MGNAAQLANLGGAYGAGSTFGFKNRIINGDMRIDQRNAGASVSTNNSYPVDRFLVGYVADGTFTSQRSTVAPAGFINSLLYTVGTADSNLGTTQFSNIRQRIEGFNTADLGWGTANAQTATLSFWVRSSVTGVFGLSISNDQDTRIFATSYTVNAANTWEQKIITIVGDTTGTWQTNNLTGIQIQWQLGLGSNYTGASGWNGSLYTPNGVTNLLATSGATFYITGVQLEKGSTATSFDYRPYGTELALCQRYFVRWKNSSSSDGSAWNPQVAPVQSGTTGNLSVTTALPVVMRTTATSVTTNLTNANYTTSWTLDSTYVTGNVTKTGTVSLNLTASAASVTLALIGATWSPNPNLFYLQTTSSYVDVSAEL